MSYKPKILEVTAGGTGLGSATANLLYYSSANNVIAQLANGTTGQVLTANTGAAPSWISTSSISVPYVYSLLSGALPTSGLTYTLQWAPSTPTPGISPYMWIVPQAATLKACYGVLINNQTLSSSENMSVILRYNTSTDITITSTLTADASRITFTNTSLSQAVSPGDGISILVTNPSWVTPPIAYTISLTLLLE